MLAIPVYVAGEVSVCTSLPGCSVAACYNYVQGVKDKIFNASP
jgi:hypothetical protein